MEWLIDLLGHLGAPWVAGALALLLVFNHTGILQTWYRGSEERHASEREQLSEDTQGLIDNLRATADAAMAWRIQDQEWYREQIAHLRAELRLKDDAIQKLTEAAVSSERGNARLRHCLNNAFTYIAALRGHLRNYGMAVPPYEGWNDMMGLSADLDETLTQLFGDAQKRV